MISADAFKQGMRRLGGAVTIVATGTADKPCGLTATAVTSLSAEPPRLLTCINRQGQTYEGLQSSLVMSVNVLSADDIELAARFGGLDGTPEEKRFEKGDWVASPVGPLYLKSALASFVCKVSQLHISTTHTIAIGDIHDVHLQNDAGQKALGYLNGQWTEFSPI